MELIQDDTMLIEHGKHDTPTVRELPFLYNLIAQEVEYPQNLQAMLAQAKPEERAIMHAFFLKAATNRSQK